MSPEISVVVLAYKSGDTIEPFVENLIASLEKETTDWEIILVGNYIENSGDITPEVVTRIADVNPKIRATAKVKKGMMGWDMRTGLEMASGKTIAVIDGDNQMPFDDVLRAYTKLKEENLDLVKTYRVTREDGFYRSMISKVYNLVFSILFPGLNCRDINSKPKLMTRRVLDAMNLKSDGWFVDAEIMIFARREKLKIGEIPTVFKGIDTRQSFVRPMAIMEFVFNLLGYRVREFFSRTNKSDE